MAKASTKKAKAEEEEYEEEATEEEGAAEEEVEEEEPEAEEEEEDFRTRAKKATKAKAGKKAKEEEEEEEEEPVKKVKKMKKAAKASGGGRADWDTPWRPTSVLAEAFKMAQKGTTVKELNVLAKKNDAQPAYVLSALKREDFRGFTWKTKGDGKAFKVFNVVRGRVKKAA